MSLGNCTGKNHCGNTRTCARCARERQRLIANKAEALERQYGQLTMTVLKPELNTQAAIHNLRSAFLRRTLTPAGIWTIETGTQFAGLHVNILSPKPLPSRWKNCETYSELLRVTARDAAAYISKRSGMPALEQYAGRLYGTFGQIGEILANQTHAPIVAGASIEVALTPGEIIMPAFIHETDSKYRTPEEEKIGWNDPVVINGELIWWDKATNMTYTKKPPRPVLTREQEREIARKHLPNLYAALRPQAPPAPPAERDWLTDVL